MNDLFVNLLFGHIAGDFFFQNKWMAVNKSASHIKCLVHVLIYTFCILLFTEFNLIWAVIVFVPHFLIDRFSLADIWLKFINGRALGDFLINGHKNIPVEELSQYLNYRILRGGFSAVVYTIVDNGLHLMCLWYGYKLIN